MNTTELQLRLALVGLIKLVEEFFPIDNRTPEKHRAYVDAVNLMESLKK